MPRASKKPAAESGELKFTNSEAIREKLRSMERLEREHDEVHRIVEAVNGQGQDPSLALLWNFSFSVNEAFSDKWERLFRVQQFTHLPLLERGRFYAPGELQCDIGDWESVEYSEEYWLMAEPMRRRMRKQIAGVRELAGKHGLDDKPLLWLGRYISGTGVLSDADKRTVLDFIAGLVSKCESPAEEKSANAGDEGTNHGMLTHIQLAEKFGCSKESARKKLDRWRASHGDGWQEVTEPKHNEPKYLYSFSAVKHLFQT